MRIFSSHIRFMSISKKRLLELNETKEEIKKLLKVWGKGLNLVIKARLK
jgi:DNA topoisomerase VI subunit B